MENTNMRRALYYMCSMVSIIMSFSSLLHSADGPGGRRIAVIGFGSLVNQPNDPQRGNLEIQEPFQKASGLTFPIRLSRHSSMNKPTEKLSVVVDPNASASPVYYATSSFTSLPQARLNLADREGATGVDKKKNIAYIRKSQRQEPAENFRSGNWVGMTKVLPDSYSQKLAQWADYNGYDAVMWAGFDSNIPTAAGAAGARSAVMAKLEGNQRLLRNTQAYLSGFPDDLKSPLIKDIIAGNLTTQVGRLTPEERRMSGQQQQGSRPDTSGDEALARRLQEQWQ